MVVTVAPAHGGKWSHSGLVGSECVGLTGTAGPHELFGAGSAWRREPSAGKHRLIRNVRWPLQEARGLGVALQQPWTFAVYKVGVAFAPDSVCIFPPPIGNERKVPLRRMVHAGMLK